MIPTPPAAAVPPKSPLCYSVDHVMVLAGVMVLTDGSVLTPGVVLTSHVAQPTYGSSKWVGC